MTSATPQIETQSFVIHLPDPSLPPFFVNLVVLRGSVIINVGPAPTPFSLAHDFSCAMNVRTALFLPSSQAHPVPHIHQTTSGLPTSTALSPTASTSLSMSAKFCKLRFLLLGANKELMFGVLISAAVQATSLPLPRLGSLHHSRETNRQPRPHTREGTLGQTRSNFEGVGRRDGGGGVGYEAGMALGAESSE